MATKARPRPEAGRTDATYARIVNEICRVLSARELAAAVGVGERSVQNWRAASARPRGAAREALLDLHFVVDALSDVYTAEGVEVVLRGRAKALGDRRPLEVFASGDREAVVRLAGQLRDYGQVAARSGPGAVPVASSVEGRFFRHQAARHDRLGGSSFGGRWSPPGRFEAIYLASPLAAVVGEAYRHLVDPTAADPTLVAPRNLFAVEVELERVLDLRDEAACRAGGLEPADLAGPHDRCQAVGARAFEAGHQGVVAPAATGLGDVLCAFCARVGPDGLRVVERRLWALPADPRGAGA